MIDTSNQLSLLEEPPCEAEHPVQPMSNNKTSVNFISPDPHLIRINEVRLDDYLKQMGQTSALKIRQLLTELDWQPFEAQYRSGGRSPYAPQCMLGLILYGVMQGVSSLRPLEKLAVMDMGCLWVSGGITPDHSIIGRFIQRHEVQLSHDFFEQLTRKVLKVTGSKTDMIAGDGSVIEAAASRFKLMKLEALEKAIQDEDSDDKPRRKRPKDSNKLHQAKQVLEQRQQALRSKGKAADKIQINSEEPDAVLQPRKGNKGFSSAYKTSVMANECRVIVATAVDPVSETAVVNDLFEQAQCQGEVKTALFDAGYFSESVIKAGQERDIELLCPEGNSLGRDWNKQSAKYYPKSQFEYDPQGDHYRCPEGQQLTRISHYQGSEQNPAHTLYGSSACQQCSKMSACTRSTKGRQIKRYPIDGDKDALRRKMQQPEVRQRYLKRQGMVEPVFAHLRGQQKFNRFRRKGLRAVSVEFNLQAMAYNLSRVLHIASIKRCIEKMGRDYEWMTLPVLDKFTYKTFTLSLLIPVAR